MMTQQQTGCQVQIEFNNKEQMKKFVKWFTTDGFNTFTESKFNPFRKPIENVVTCLSSDEEMEWGHYFEIQ